MNGRLPQIAEGGAGLQQEGDAQRQLWRQPSGQAGSEARAAGGLLGRTGLFRSRSSSDREEARASEMSFVTHGPSAQAEQHQQQQSIAEEPAQDDAEKQQPGCGMGQEGFGGVRDPLGAVDQGHLAPDVPHWAQEGEELSDDDFMLGASQHEDMQGHAADSCGGFPEPYGHLPFAAEHYESPRSEACSLHRDGAGSFDRGSAQLIGPPQGWHAQSQLQSAQSGGLFEPLHEAMLEPHATAQGSPGSSLTWHDEQAPSEEDIEAGFGGLLESSLQNEGMASPHWDPQQR